MISLTVAAMDGKTDAYKKTVEDLQSDVVIGETGISGTLKYVTEYTGFSSKADEQSGNYLALKVEVPEGAEVTTELVNGKKGSVNLSKDKFCVYRISDKDKQKIKFTVSVNEESVTKTYDLTGLVLNTQ